MQEVAFCVLATGSEICAQRGDSLVTRWSVCGSCDQIYSFVVSLRTGKRHEPFAARFLRKGACAMEEAEALELEPVP